ncbi:MAG: hypothetical protein SFV54_28895 [Bryobacteraceae bacterium]|nr:hypothetical protein [Bryobacteraceae bacterium]
MTRKAFSAVPVVIVLGLLTSCAPEPTAKKEAVKKAEPEKAEPVGALKAFYQVYPMARQWSSDVEVLTMTEIRLASVKAEPGLAPAWKVTFVSPSKQRQRDFIYSTVKEEGLEKGNQMGRDDSYSQRGQQRTFRTQALKIDSTAAYKTALDKSAEYVKKNPDKPVTFLLENTTQLQNPAWRVIWGDSVTTSNYSIYVDATTGEYVKTMR